MDHSWMKPFCSTCAQELLVSSQVCIPLAHVRWQQEQHLLTIRVGVLRQHWTVLLALDTYIHLQLLNMPRDWIVVGPCTPQLPVQ